MSLITVENMSKRYGKQVVLNEINLKVEPGEVVGIIGPNGAGKTTLFNCLLGLVRPSSGKVLVNGQQPQALAVHAMRGFMPERPAFDTRMSAREFLFFHYCLIGRKLKDAKAEIERTLDDVEFEEKARRRQIRTFSRGMLQRVGLAQVLIGRPSICILDEPASGLDPTGVSMVRRLVERWKQEGTTVLVSSHHLDEVEKTCTRVAFLRGGRIDRLETVSEITGTSMRFIVHWGTSVPNHELAASAARLSIAMELLGTHSARFIIEDRAQVPALLEELLKAGVPVEEALFERKNLENICVEWLQEQP